MIDYHGMNFPRPHQVRNPSLGMQEFPYCRRKAYDLFLELNEGSLSHFVHPIEADATGSSFTAWST